MKVIEKFELLTDLCISNPDRIVAVNENKKDKFGEEEDESEVEVLNTQELLEEWDYADYKIVDEDEEPDPEN